MIEPEAFQLLTLASARDNRKVSQSTAKVWADDLSDVSLVDAAAALREHYRERPDVYLLPGHILSGARKIWKQRREQQRIQRQLTERTAEPPPLSMTLAEAYEKVQRGEL